MVSVATKDNEILAKQIEVKATGASDVKIYANGASQKTSGVDATDNSVNKNSAKKCGCKPISIFNPTQKENPFGKFDITGDGKLDKAELAAMEAYIKALKEQQVQKPEKIDKPDSTDKTDKQNMDILLVLVLILIGQMIEQEKDDIVKNEGDKQDFEKIA